MKIWDKIWHYWRAGRNKKLFLRYMYAYNHTLASHHFRRMNYHLDRLYEIVNSDKQQNQLTVEDS